MTQAVTPGVLRTNNVVANSSGGDGSGAPTKKRPAAAVASPGTAASGTATSAIAERPLRAPSLTKITHGFVPLSLLVNRLVQDSFNELQVMVESISSSAMSSEDKKARIVKYAINTRKQFIKLFVLTVWSNDAGPVSDVIDLKAWLDNQFRVFDGMVTVLCDIRKTTGRARWAPIPGRAACLPSADLSPTGFQIQTWLPLSKCCPPGIPKQT